MRYLVIVFFKGIRIGVGRQGEEQPKGLHTYLMNAFIQHCSVYRSVYFEPKLGSSGSAHIWDQGSRRGRAGSPLDPEGSIKVSEKGQEVAEGPESFSLKA